MIRKGRGVKKREEGKLVRRWRGREIGGRRKGGEGEGKGKESEE